MRYLFFALLALCHFHLFSNQNVREFLNAIPKSDREGLENLFKSLFNRENFCYTLFGDKPMSLTQYLTTSFDRDGIPSNKGLRFQKRWELWKKYAHVFPMKHYLLVESPIDYEGTRQIFFVNKRLFIDKVDEHLDLFQEALGQEIEGTILLEKIEQEPKLLSFFDHSPLLLGVLLGYGKHNAWLFAKRDKLSPFVYRKELPKIPVKIPSPSEGFPSLQEEFNSYFSILTLFGDPGYSPLVIHSVHFAADHQHPETMILREKYRRMRGEISAIYASGNFLEITLSKLVED